MFFSTEINRKRNVRNLLLRKTDVLKTCCKSKFLGKKIWRNALALKNKKVQGIFRETFVLALLSLAVAAYKILSQLSFILYYSGDKGLLSELKNEVDFSYIMNVSPNILARNLNFKKLGRGFVYEKALITVMLISSCYWKILEPFCLWKRRPETVFLTLIFMNYQKIV